MAKSRNNLLGVGGQRKKLSRAEQHGAGTARDADRRTAADQKQELLRKMRERSTGPESSEASDASNSTTAPDDATEQDAPAQN